MQTLRKIMTLAAPLAAAAIVLVGCSSDGDGSTSPPPTSSAPGSPAPASSEPASVPPKTVDTTTTTTVDAPRSNPDTPSSSAKPQAGDACTNGDLRISAGPVGGATGHAATVLLFRNVSSSSCTLHGYPGLDAVSGNRTVAHAKRTPSGFTGGSKKGEPTVRVASGVTASAKVEWTQFGTGGSDCRRAPQLLVTAANTTRAVRLDVDVATCNLQVHPTVPGTTGDLR